jgi:hypothetical protein
VKRRYPLETLSRIRAHETTLRAREKAELAGERHRAEENLAAAIQAKDAEKGRLRNAGAVESMRLGSGRTRAADLSRAERFRHDAERRIEAREEAEASATRIAAEASVKERRAAAALVSAHAAEKVVAEHRARFRASESRSRDNREDEAAEDTRRARPVRGGQKHR